MQVLTNGAESRGRAGGEGHGFKTQQCMQTSGKALEQRPQQGDRCWWLSNGYSRKASGHIRRARQCVTLNAGKVCLHHDVITANCVHALGDHAVPSEHVTAILWQSEITSNKRCSSSKHQSNHHNNTSDPFWKQDFKEETDSFVVFGNNLKC